MNISPELLQSIMQMAAKQNIDLSAYGLGNGLQNNNNTKISPVPQERSQNPSANSKGNAGNRTPINTTPNSKSNPFNTQNQGFKKSFGNGNGNSHAFGNNGNNNFNRNPQGNKPSFQTKKEFGQDSGFMNNNQTDLTVLMVAEKPSIARSIAEALSPGRSRSRKGIIYNLSPHYLHIM